MSAETVVIRRRRRRRPLAYDGSPASNKGRGPRAEGQAIIFDRLIELCLTFLIIFSPLPYGSNRPWPVAIIEITAALMFFLWGFKTISNGKVESLRNTLTLFIFLFIGYVCLQRFLPSGIYLPSSVYPWATKTALIKVISYSIIFFVTLNTIRTKRQIGRLLSAMVIMGILMSIFFLMRYYGFKAPQGFVNRDHFAGYLGMIIPLALGFLFIPSRTIGKGQHSNIGRYSLVLPEQKLLIFFTAVVMSVVLFFTMSRGGMVSFTIALLFMTGLMVTRKSLRKNGLILLAAALLIALTVIWLGAMPVIERIGSMKDEISSIHFAGRIRIWQGTINTIKDFPIFGTGLGTFNYIFPKYQFSDIIDKHYTYAHSDILEMLSETGIAGFTFFAFGALLFVTYAIRRFYARHYPWCIGLSLGFFGSLASISSHSFVDFGLKMPANAVLLSIILALFLIVLNYDHKSHNKHPYNEIQYPIYGIRYSRYPLYTLTVLLTGSLIFASIRPLIKEDPMNAAYHHALGKSYIREAKGTNTKEISIEHMESALESYKEAVRLNPTNAKYHQSLAWTYGWLAGRLNEREYTRLAHQHFQTAISFEPNSAYRHRAYAIWLFNHPSSKNIQKAVVEYRKAIEIEPRLGAEAIVKYYRYKKDYERVVEILPGTQENDLGVLRALIKEKGLKYSMNFVRFFKTYPKNPELHFWIADRNAYGNEFPLEFTEEHYRVVFENAPRNAEYRKWYGMHLGFKRKYGRAVENLQMAIDMGLDPESENEAIRYIALYKERALRQTPGDYAKESEEYRKDSADEFAAAISLEPNNPYLRRTYALWLFDHANEENIEKGVTEYREAIKLNPRLGGEAILDYYKYENDYKKVTEILPGTEKTDLAALKYLARQKGLSYAMDFAKFFKTYSYNTPMHFYIVGQSYHDKDFPWEFTEEHYRIVLRNAPRTAVYRMWYGLHLSWAKKYEGGLQNLRVAIDMGLSPEDEGKARKAIAKCRTVLKERYK